ncbi:glycosyltransferase [Patescibacteria group bacterium]|nr:glycosyltransferase [Patescibacteria group bacterium]
MKNILILITKAEVGGAQMSVFNLARKLKEKGFPITVGFGTGTFLADKLKDLNIPTKRFSYLKRTISPYTNIRFIFETKKYIDTHNIDVIHLNSTNTLFAAIAAKLSNNKPNVIFTHRGLSLLDKDYKQSALIRLYAKISFTLLLPLVHHQVFVSKENQTQAQRFSFVKNDTVIYNGLDQQLLKFYPKEQAHEFFEKKNRPITTK